MSISAVYDLKLAVTETLSSSDAAFVSSSDATLLHQLRINGTLNASSSPDAELIASGQKALSTGAVTLDLTALLHRGVAVSFSGKKVRLAFFRNPSTNANPITIAEGASNGNALLGSGFSVTLQPGDCYLMYLGDSSQTVGGSDKDIDLTGTGSQALDYLLVAG